MKAGAVRETFEEAGARIIELKPYALYNLTFVNQVYIMFRASLPEPVFYAGDESLEVRHRAVDTLKRITQHYDSGSTLLICTHNFVIVSLLCYASNTSLNRFRDWKQDTGALNVIYKDENHFQIIAVNDNQHLKTYLES